MTEREAETSAPAGPVVNAAATSAGVPPCAPIPASRSTERGSSARASRDLARERRADDRADRRETALADQVLAPAADEPAQRAARAAPVGERDVLHVGATGVRRLHEAEDPGALTPARLEKRLHGIAAEIRVDRDGVGERDERLRIRARGRADVAALRIGDDEQAGGARVLADLRERAHAVGAVRLEERRLRLHRDRVRRDRVDDAGAEREEIAVHLGRQLLDDRVEPDDELAAACARRPRRAGRRSASRPRSPSCGKSTRASDDAVSRRGGACRLSRLLTADLSALPAENFGTRAAGMCTFSVGLRGLTPMRALRSCVWNFPNPVNATSPPPRSVSVIVSRNASTAFPASRAVSWLRRATSATNSCLVTCLSSCRSLHRLARP